MEKELILNDFKQVNEKIETISAEVLNGKFYLDGKTQKDKLSIIVKAMDVKTKVDTKYKEFMDQFKEVSTQYKTITAAFAKLEKDIKTQYIEEFNSTKVTKDIEVAGIKTSKKVAAPKISGLSISNLTSVTMPKFEDGQDMPQSVTVTTKKEDGTEIIQLVSVVKTSYDVVKIKKLEKEFKGVFKTLGVKTSPSQSVSLKMESLVSTVKEMEKAELEKQGEENAG